MTKLSIDDMMSGRKSKYSLVMAVAKRAREISAEAEENEYILEEKAVNLAIEDFLSGDYEIFSPDEPNDE